MTQFDPVSKPEHYNKGKIECIDAIESAVEGLDGIEAVCTANVLKYCWRWKQKGGKEDLRKARWYINRLLGEEDPGEQFDEGKIKKLEDELAEVKLRRLETVAMCDMLKAELEQTKLDSVNYHAKCGLCNTANKDILTESYCSSCDNDELRDELAVLKARLEKYEAAHRAIRSDFEEGRAYGLKFALARLDPLQSDGT